MGKGFYVALSQAETVNGREHDDPLLASSPASRKWKLKLATLCGLLIASLITNVYFYYLQYIKPWDLATKLPTRYANLRGNVPTKINYFDDFQSVDHTIQNAAWDDGDLEPWETIVALDEDLTIRLGLPHSQRWPWDLGKGVYITVAAHDLHCLRAIRETVNQNFDGIPLAEQTWSYEHITHCLNVLRVGIMCHADDQPMYMGNLHDNINRSEPRAGYGQTRMCRDWGAFLDWTRAHSACYKPIDQFNKSYPEVDRYKHCPDGARPWENL